jgi:DNA-binding transcriptional MocR family regulator
LQRRSARGLRAGSIVRGRLPAQRLAGRVGHPALRALVASQGTEITDFGTALGYPLLRELIARRTADVGLAITADQVLLTNGATHAFDLIIRYLVNPGDAVLVDDPGYYNLFGHLRLAGARLLPVPRGADGPDLATLARLAAEHRPRAYFTMSVLNNPTCTHIQPGVAHRLLQLAAQYRFYVVEDDIFSDLATAPPPRLSALDRLERTFYVGSFSKTLSGSLRSGFLVAQPDAIDSLARLKLLTGLTTPAFAERLVHAMLAGGHYRKHVARIRERLDTRRARMAQELERAGWVLAGVPDCGLFLWARHPGVETRSGSRRVRGAKACAWRPALRSGRCTMRARGCASRWRAWGRPAITAFLRAHRSWPAPAALRARLPKRSSRPRIGASGTRRSDACAPSRIWRFASSGPTQPDRRTHLPGSRSL